MKRTITIEFDIAFPYGKIEKPVSDAVGYLSAWAIDAPRYVNVNIYGTANGEFYAQYADADGVQTYSIYAKPDLNDELELKGYSFHS